MNLSEVYDLLEAIASVSARTVKEQMLKDALEDETFLKVCTYAYDPFRTYGLAPTMDTRGRGTNSDPDSMFELLDQLAARSLTGKAATLTTQAMWDQLSPEAGVVLTRILRKDLRAGFTSGSINRARPDTIYVFKSMLAHPYEAKRIKSWPVAVEPKLDGVRVLARVDYDAGTAQFFSRNGKPFPAVEHLGEWLLGSSDSPDVGVWFYDGEVVTSDFYDSVGAVRRKSEKAEQAEFHIFDVLTDDEFLNGSNRTYESRRKILEAFIKVFDNRRQFCKDLIANGEPIPPGRYPPLEGECPIKIVDMHLAHNAEDIQTYYSQWRSEGLEGAIVKPIAGKWVPKRSHDWLKIKAQETLDLRVVDAIEGEGKYKGMLGALVVELDGVRINVGSGFSDELRRELWKDARPDGTEMRLSPFGRLIEIEYHEKTPDGSLRHPRFIRFRDDKAEAEAA